MAGTWLYSPLFTATMMFSFPRPLCTSVMAETEMDSLNSCIN
jgi:hypothetical protein